MPSSLLSSGFSQRFSQVSSQELLKHKTRTRHKQLRRLKRRGGRVGRFVLFVIAVGFLVKGTLVEAFYIPSTSMTPTLQEKDYILVEKLRYGLRLPFVDATLVPWGEPERGDIVVFRRSDDPNTTFDESSEELVKRVIGVEGDIIEIDKRSVFVNGELLYEPYAVWGIEQEVRLTFLVPPGALFVLGDNRGDSFDSRYWTDPFVAREQVVGKATVAYWNPDRVTEPTRLTR